MKKLFLILITCFSIQYNFLAQDFGEISEQELKMSEIAEDPDANAVILIDKADMKINRDFEFEMKVYRRIKILTEEGKKYGDVSIPYWIEDHIYDIEAACYNPNGEVFEIDGDNIIETESDDFYSTNFLIPGIVAGSVIEYSYKYISEHLYRLKPWVFQDKDFTKFSQLNVIIPPGFTYNSLGLNLKENNIKREDVKTWESGGSVQEVMKFTWTGVNLPGIKEEPFVNNLDDKYAKLYFFINSYKSPTVNINFAKTWETISKNLSENFYDEFIEEDGLTGSKCSEIIGKETDELKKAKLIYDFVRSEIKTESAQSIFSSKFKSPNEVLQDKSGSISNKNMLLVNLLIKAGLYAKPLLVSTKSNGEVIPEFINPEQFNTILCYLQLSKNVYYLNAGPKANPFGYLTPSTDVAIGFVVDGANGFLVALKPMKPANRLTVSTAGEIKENYLKASTKIVYSGYPAYEERSEIEDQADIKKYVEEKLKTLNDEAVLDSFYYSALDSINKPLQLNVTYTLPNHLTESENMAYFSAPFFSDVKENPFKSKERLFSIDFDYEFIAVEKCIISFPEIYQVNSIPGTKALKTDGFVYSKMSFQYKDRIEIVRSSELKKRQIPSNSYSQLKSFYEDMISADQEQIVLSNENQINKTVKSTTGLK